MEINLSHDELQNESFKITISCKGNLLAETYRFKCPECANTQIGMADQNGIPPFNFCGVCGKKLDISCFDYS